MSIYDLFAEPEDDLTELQMEMAELRTRMHIVQSKIDRINAAKASAWRRFVDQATAGKKSEW